MDEQKELAIDAAIEGFRTWRFRYYEDDAETLR